MHCISRVGYLQPAQRRQRRDYMLHIDWATARRYKHSPTPPLPGHNPLLGLLQPLIAKQQQVTSCACWPGSGNPVVRTRLGLQRPPSPRRPCTRFGSPTLATNNMHCSSSMQMSRLAPRQAQLCIHTVPVYRASTGSQHLAFCHAHPDVGGGLDWLVSCAEGPGRADTATVLAGDWLVAGIVTPPPLGHTSMYCMSCPGFAEACTAPIL